MPIDSVTAKPRIGPVPNWNRKSAAISVVTLVSMIDDSALLEARRRSPTATVRPARSSSRMRSKMSTLASTAMPMVSTMPAMPGRVSVAPK